jgi:anhydro-N-acetylmuramic acid kinase
VDAALVEIEESSAPKLLCFTTLPIPDEIRTQIFACSETGNAGDICRLNFHLGEVFAEAATVVIRKAGLMSEQVDLIGSHGQTIYHIPPKSEQTGSTLQIAEPSVIANRTGITTVADFRGADMAVGGQGAPLLPILHYRLFSVPDNNVVVINIGGISNVSYLSGSMEESEVMAFDTGPGNMVIDALTKKYFDRPYDENGDLAATGKTDYTLLEELIRHSFLTKIPPKSTGREEFGASFVEKIARQAKKRKAADRDVLHTVTEFTACSIAQNCELFFPGSLDKVWICGGGAKNKLLMELLAKKFLPVPVKSSAEFGVDPDALEAMGFAYIAYRTIRGLTGNLPYVTGAKEAVVLGKIVPAGKYFRDD